MLFNSYAFLLVFLPIVLVGCYVLAGRSAKLAAPWLVTASIVFYGWWDPRHVLLLVGSISLNYRIGSLIAKQGGAAGRPGRPMLIAGIVANLCVLGYFKYIGFLTVNANALFGASFSLAAPLLPLGISFFTFTQIAYLVDVYRQPVRYPPIAYALFVTYFPHLIAGPILHHKEMLPQFQAHDAFRFNAGNLAAGLTILAIGLFKKVVLADGIAPYSGPVFEGAAYGYAPGGLEAWGATLAFGLQLYFDFSAYSDMAIGLSKMFGVRMPVNFHSPYKAASIIEFWRRWHMTLSRFLREYLYFALGGNRRGTVRRYANLLATMVIGGLWHGAAWTFVAWGAFHGVMIALNHAWRSLRSRAAAGPIWLRRIERWVGMALTFVAVFAGWALFKAQDLPSAMLVLKGMAGLHGFAVPPPWLIEIGEMARGIARADLALPSFIREWIVLNIASVDQGVPRGLAEGRHAGVLIEKAQVFWIGTLLAIVWFAPNTNQIMMRAHAFIFPTMLELRQTGLCWRTTSVWALGTALMLVTSFSMMSRVSEFLYFQF